MNCLTRDLAHLEKLFLRSHTDSYYDRHVRVIEQQQIQREELAMRPGQVEDLFGQVSDIPPGA